MPTRKLTLQHLTSVKLGDRHFQCLFSYLINFTGNPRQTDRTINKDFVKFLYTLYKQDPHIHFLKQVTQINLRVLLFAGPGVEVALSFLDLYLSLYLTLAVSFSSTSSSSSSSSSMVSGTAFLSSVSSLYLEQGNYRNLAEISQKSKFVQMHKKRIRKILTPPANCLFSAAYLPITSTYEQIFQINIQFSILVKIN